MLARWARLFPFLLVLLLPVAARAGDDGPISVAEAATRARDLANRLQAALDPDQCESVTSCRVTAAAAILDNGKAVVATSEPGNYLRSPLAAIRDSVGAETAGGTGHAEAKIINFVRGSLFYYKRKILAVAAGRPICEPCEQKILAASARPGSACKSGRRY